RYNQILQSLHIALCHTSLGVRRVSIPTRNQQRPILLKSICPELLIKFKCCLDTLIVLTCKIAIETGRNSDDGGNRDQIGEYQTEPSICGFHHFLRSQPGTFGLSWQSSYTIPRVPLVGTSGSRASRPVLCLRAESGSRILFVSVVFEFSASGLRISGSAAPAWSAHVIDAPINDMLNQIPI